MNISIICVCFKIKFLIDYRCGSRIWSRGSQLLRPKVADVAKQSHMSWANHLWPGSRVHFRALEVLGFLMLKCASSHILETLFLSFLTVSSGPKTDKNSTSYYTSINLRYFYILHPFFNIHEKVMPLIDWVKEVC